MTPVVFEPQPVSANSSLHGARVAFTGRLASMPRSAAFERLRQAGGYPVAAVTRRTHVLVVGLAGLPLKPDGAVSRPLEAAQALNRQGATIRILSEREFLEQVGVPLGKQRPAADFSARAVCELLGISREALRRWTQCGLLHCADDQYDFRDLVSLRAVAELVQQGARPEAIARGLRGLAQVLPETERPLAQLKLVLEGSRTLLADLGHACIAPDGQLALNFGAAEPDAPPTLSLHRDAPLDALGWFERGRQAEESEHYEDAAEAYREALALSPRFPEAAFNLGNVLRCLGRPEAAAELFQIAARQAPDRVEAWYNLADAEEECGRVDEAIAALRSAIAADPHYADAHFNLARCCELLGEFECSRTHWQAYLRLDPHSGWARIARQRLAELRG